MDPNSRLTAKTNPPPARTFSLQGTEHNYRHGKGGKKKTTVKSLYDQVAAGLFSPPRSTPREKK